VAEIGCFGCWVGVVLPTKMFGKKIGDRQLGLGAAGMLAVSNAFWPSPLGRSFEGIGKTGCWPLARGAMLTDYLGIKMKITEHFLAIVVA